MKKSVIGLILFGFLLMVFVSFVSAQEDTVWLDPHGVSKVLQGVGTVSVFQGDDELFRSYQQDPTLRTCEEFGYECGTYSIVGGYDENCSTTPAGDTSGEYCGESIEECFDRINPDDCQELTLRECTDKPGLSWYWGYWWNQTTCEKRILPLSCGTCNNGGCIVGKCYDYNELGSCIVNSGFPPSESEKEAAAQLCSELGEKCLGPLGRGAGFYGCRWENFDLYTPRMYWQKTAEPNIGKSALYITITDEMLANPEIINIPVQIVVEKSPLKPGKVVSILIWGQIGEVAVIPDVIVDEDSGFIADWDINDEVLDKINYYKDADSQLEFYVVNSTPEDKDAYGGKGGWGDLVGYGETNRYNTTIRVSPEPRSLFLRSKKGDCSGTIPCRLLNKEACEGIHDETLYGFCNWNNEKNLCDGEGIYCSVLEDKEICEGSFIKSEGFIESVDMSDYCSWKGNSFWDNFKSWFSKILGKVIG